MNLRLTIAALTVLGRSTALWAQSAPPATVPAPAAHRWVVPLAPSELLKLLPNAPDQWQLKQSTAKNFVMDWPSSQAQREFSYTPPNPDVSPAPVHVLRITVTDTGYYAGLMSDLQSAQAPKSGEAESLTISGFPARRIMVGKTQEQLRLLVKSRYVIQLDVQNEPAGNAQKWLGIVDLTKFAALPAEGEVTLPRPFSVMRIDELNPKNNAASKVNFTTQEEADQKKRR